MEYGRNYQTYKPIQDEYRQIRWKGKQEKFAEARRAELTLWDAANRYLHANLPKGTKTLPIAEWEPDRHQKGRQILVLVGIEQRCGKLLCTHGRRIQYVCHVQRVVEGIHQEGVWLFIGTRRTPVAKSS